MCSGMRTVYPPRLNKGYTDEYKLDKGRIAQQQHHCGNDNKGEDIV